MAIRIVVDEMYPFYDITEATADHEIEADSATVRRWRRVMGQFKQVQNEMAAALGGDPVWEEAGE